MLQKIEESGRQIHSQVDEKKEIIWIICDESWKELRILVDWNNNIIKEMKLNWMRNWIKNIYINTEKRHGKKNR